jgi:hypothetical protein
MSVCGGVVLGGFFGVMHGLQMVAVRHMGMMAGPLVIAGFVVFRGGPVMPRGLFVVLCSLAMVFSAFFRHGDPL